MSQPALICLLSVFLTFPFHAIGKVPPPIGVKPIHLHKQSLHVLATGDKANNPVPPLCAQKKLPLPLSTITSIPQSQTQSQNSDTSSSDASSELKLPVNVDAKKEASQMNSTSHSFLTSTHRAKEAVEPPPDPKTSDIQAGKETTIELAKEKIGLGLSIVGGHDTPLVSTVYHIRSLMVHAVLNSVPSPSPLCVD